MLKALYTQKQATCTMTGPMDSIYQGLCYNTVDKIVVSSYFNNA